MPILRLFPGLPNRVFFSGAAAFFGGMFLFFFACAGDETEKCLETRSRWVHDEGGGGRRRAEMEERLKIRKVGIWPSYYNFPCD